MNTISFKTKPADSKLCGRSVLDIFAVIDGTEYTNQFLDYFGIVASSTTEEAEFYLFTCSCGTAGCAGYHIPMQMKMTESTVTWKAEDKLSEVLGTDTLVFDRSAYLKAVSDLRATVEAKVGAGWVTLDLVESYYEDDEELPDLDSKYKSTMKWAEAHYKDEADIANVIRLTSTPHYGKHFSLSYPGATDSETEFRWLVLRCLNQFPEDGGKNYYLAKVRYAATALSAFIDTGETKMLSRIVESQYRKCRMTSGDFAYFYESRADPESIDWAKLVIKEAA